MPTVTDEKIERHVGVPEFVTPEYGTHRDSTYAVKWSGIDLKGPKPLVRRSDLHPGDLIQSSHGYRLYLTRVKFRVTGSAGQQSWIEGRLHGPDGKHTRDESYEAHSTVPLLARGGVTFERAEDDSLPIVPVTAEEQARSYVEVDGRTIDRTLEG